MDFEVVVEVLNYRMISSIKIRNVLQVTDLLHLDEVCNETDGYHFFKTKKICECINLGFALQASFVS